MKKIITILALMLLLAACNGGEDTSGPAPASNFVGGSVGIDIGLIEGAPPAEIADQNQPFGIAVNLENKGDYTIPQGETSLRITGIDPQDFGSDATAVETSDIEELLGAKINPQGDRIRGTTVTVDFPTDGNVFQNDEEIAGAVTYNIRAEACYRYETTANALLCILDDLLGVEGNTNNICVVNEDKVVAMSGGPVHITRLTESAAGPDKVQFVFDVEHVGPGTVHSLDTGLVCDGSFENKDKVQVTVSVPGLNSGLSCSGMTDVSESGDGYTGTVTLLNDKRQVRCTLDLDNPADQEKRITITLASMYKDNADTQLTVKHYG